MALTDARCGGGAPRPPSAGVREPECTRVDTEKSQLEILIRSTYHEHCFRRPVGDVAREHKRLLARAVFEGARHPERVDLAALRHSLEPLHALRAFAGDVAYTYAESGLRSEHSPIRIEHFFASASRALGASSVVLHGLRQDGAVHFTMNYTSPLQSDGWVSEVTGTFRRILEESSHS